MRQQLHLRISVTGRCESRHCACYRQSQLVGRLLWIPEPRVDPIVEQRDAGTDATALSPVSTKPLAYSPYHGGGLRYLDIVPLPGGRHRLYYEMTRPDGSHALLTELRSSG